MRRGLLWLLLPAVIVVLVWVAAATPLGWHTVTTQLERALSERTGLEVEIGSLEGNLLRRINIENVSLFDPAGLTIARVGTVSASYNAFALLRRRVAISELIIDDTDLLFDVDPNGDLVGWSRLAVADTSAGEESSGLGGWTIDARVAVRNLNAVVRDTGHGFALSLVGLDADASGGLDAYEAGLSCSLMIDYEGAAAAVAGRLRGSIAGSGSELVVRDFGLETAPVRVEGAARIAFPDAGGDSAARTAHVVEGRFGVDIALDELGLIVEGAHPTGAVSIGGSFEGPVDSLAYRAQIASDMVAFEGTEITGLIADVTGDPVAGQLRGLSARLAGGSLSASGAWRLAGSPDPGHGESDGQSEASFDVDVALRNADVAVLGAGIAAEQRPGGRLDLDLTLAAAALDPERLNGAGRAKIGGLTIGDRLIGDLDVEFGIESGDARAWGSCCGVEFDVRAALDAGAVDSLSFFASTADLSIPGAALGASELSGDGRVSGTILHPTDEPLLRVRADFPRLSFRDIETGPVVATAVGRSGVYEFGASVLDGAVTADGVFRETGTYEAALRVEDLGLERVVADSLRRLLALSGSFSGSAIVHGDTSGVFEAAGTVTALTTEIGEERMALERPTSFRASQRSLAVDDLTLSGTLGRVSIHGESADSLDLSITFADIDVGAAAALVPQRGGQLSPRGLLNGVVRLAGSLNEMRLAADATIEALGVGDIDVGTLSCEVETDREEVVFSVDVLGSTGGAINASGLLPVLVDSAGALGLDGARDFGVSVACSSFTLDAAPWLLPEIRGRKTITIDGSMLVSGRGDSVSTVNGMGEFDRFDVRLEPIELHLARPTAFWIAGGDVGFDSLRVELVRRRILGKSAGGSVTASGLFGHDGSLSLRVAADSLQIGSLLGAFVPSAGDAIRGALVLDATLSGTFEQLRSVFSWAITQPVISGVGFDRLEGVGSSDGRSVVLDRVELALGGQSLTVSGSIPLEGWSTATTGTSPEEPPRELDLRIRAQRFRLNALRDLPGDLQGLDGEIDIDMTVAGRIESPQFGGTARLRGGGVRWLGLSHRIQGVRFDVRAEGGTITIENGSAQVGKGKVQFSGFTQIGPGGSTFWAGAELRGAEIGMEEMFDARLGGRVTWAGDATSSEISGRVVVEKAEVSYSVGLDDVLRQRRPRTVVRRSGNPLARVGLDLDVEIADRVLVRSNLARIDLTGGFHFGGNALTPMISGSVSASEGAFNYLDNDFTLSVLNVVYVDPRRQDPYVELSGIAEVESRAGDLYVVTVRFEGFLLEAVPDLSSVPPLSEPDIISLLTFGDTFGGFASGGTGSGSSSDRFAALARASFISSMFGIAESTLEKLLRLDTVAIDQKSFKENGLVGSDVTLGKRFGDRLKVEYTTALGRFDEREAEVSFRLTEMLSIETRADPEGNHSVGLKLRVPFK